MRAVIQRVNFASVEVDKIIKGQINSGLLVFLGVEPDDVEIDLNWLALKIVNLRIFSDDQGLMNKSVKDINGDILLISQFTLLANTQKGNRPSFMNAAPANFAEEFYEKMIVEFSNLMLRPIQKGVFGADMKINLLNDGPVTIIMDTKDKSRH